MSHRPDATDIESSRADGPVEVDVVGLGLNAMDFVAFVSEFPRPDSKVEIRELSLEPGGQVATALVTCRRLGLRVRYLGSVGSDDLGRAQLESLRREGIATDHVRIVEGATTQTAIAIVPEGTGERTILWHRDSRLTFPPESVGRAALEGARLLHLDGRDSRAALAAARMAEESGIPVMVDIDKRYDETTEELLGRVDYLIAAGSFALEITGCRDEVEAAMALSERFPRALSGITLGAGGAVFVDEGRPVRSPAFEVEVRDTTGAGDVFHGAFIFGVLSGWDLHRTIRFAHATAAMKCRAPGARRGIPALREVQEFLETARERAF
jgi:sugar/nucleoside kinase (ribokinase family)